MIVLLAGKEHAHRWDLLTSDVKKFKGLIDKDLQLLSALRT